MMDRESGAAPFKEIENAAFIEYSGDLLTVAAASPFPPGSRVRLSLELDAEEKPLLLQGKVVSITKKAPGGFAIKIRLHTLPKNQKAALASAADLRRRDDEIKS